MPNRSARFTVADLRRAVRAGEQVGPEWFVKVLPDGTIRVPRGRLRSRLSPTRVVSQFTW